MKQIREGEKDIKQNNKNERVLKESKRDMNNTHKKQITKSMIQNENYK